MVHISEQARPSTPDNKTSITISVPASELGQDLEITLSPKKPRTNAVATPTPTKPLPKPDFSSATVEDYANPPKVRDLPIVDITETPPKSLVEYRVPLDFMQQFPPKEPDAFNTGWKTVFWYVVTLGVRPGIYFDYWGNVETTTRVPRGYGKRANDWKDAQLIWNFKVKKARGLV